MGNRDKKRRRSRSRSKRRKRDDSQAKKQARLAKARMLAQLGEKKRDQYVDEDDLDMVEIEENQQVEPNPEK